MMRDLKFRAWNGERMLPVFLINMVEGTVLVDEGRHDMTDNVYTWRFDDIELMQSTGLKDKNGVEIFEGDIVDDNFVGVGTVKYNDKHAAFKIIYKNNRAKWFVDMLEKEQRIITVIGNIHANPELMENSK